MIVILSCVAETLLVCIHACAHPGMVLSGILVQFVDIGCSLVAAAIAADAFPPVLNDMSTEALVFDFRHFAGKRTVRDSPLTSASRDY